MAAGDNYQHVTISSASVTSLTLPTGTSRIEIMNRSGAGEIYFGFGAGVTVDIEDNFPVVPAAVGAALPFDVPNNHTVLRLIASASTTVSVSVIA